MSVGTSARKAGSLAAPLALILALATGAPAQEEEKPAKEKEHEKMTVTLAEVNDSGITGVAKIARATEAEDPHAHRITVELTGVATGTYPAHIHRGTCEASGGVAVPLTAIDVEEGASMATASTTVTPSQLAAERAEGEDEMAGGEETQEYAAGDEPRDHGPLYIQVHLANGTPAACGNLTHGEKDHERMKGEGHEGHEKKGEGGGR